MFTKMNFNQIPKTFNDICEIVDSAASCNCCERHKINRPSLSDFLKGSNCIYVKENSVSSQMQCFCNCRHIARKYCRDRFNILNNEYSLLKGYVENHCLFEIPMTKEELEKEKQDFKNDETLYFKEFAECKIDEMNMCKYFLLRTINEFFYIETDGFYNVKLIEKF